MVPVIVDLAWWQARAHGLVTADVRHYLDGRSAREAYDRGHLPGAVFVDLERALARQGEPRDGRHPLPAPEVFAAAMGAVGIGDADVVVAYDDAGGTTAARLVWMLRALGQDAALLDGGLQSHPGPPETQAAVRPPTRFTARPWPADRLATIDDAADPANLVLDARDANRYRGEFEPVDPQAGHIPGARSLPCREHLREDGRLVDRDALRARFAAVGVTAGASAPVISYCGSGVTACHNLLALEHAGLGTGRLYPGSWSQYSNTPGRPVATGADA